MGGQIVMGQPSQAGYNQGADPQQVQVMPFNDPASGMYNTNNMAMMPTGPMTDGEVQDLISRMMSATTGADKKNTAIHGLQGRQVTRDQWVSVCKEVSGLQQESVMVGTHQSVSDRSDMRGAIAEVLQRDKESIMVTSICNQIGCGPEYAMVK